MIFKSDANNLNFVYYRKTRPKKDVTKLGRPTYNEQFNSQNGTRYIR